MPWNRALSPCLPPVTDYAQPGYLLTLWQAAPQELERNRDICDTPPQRARRPAGPKLLLGFACGRQLRLFG